MCYQVPVCECGGTLLFHDSYGVEDYYYITKEGKQSKKKIPVKQLRTNVCKNLECDSCCRLYSFDFDNNDRIIRMDEIY